jgi:hypothetical protein
MDKPIIRITRDRTADESFYDLSLDRPVDQASPVCADLERIAGEHDVVSDGGGCYLVKASTVQGGTVTLFGGMHVSMRKYNEVIAMLRSLGYKMQIDD